MNFELTEDQKLIDRTVADFVKKEVPIERFRKMRDDDIGFSRDVWKQMGELGWLGIAYPESVGGFGGSFVDASLIVQRFGTTLVSEPYTESAVVAGQLLLALGSDAQAERWLAPMIAGDTVLALAHHEEGNRFSGRRLTTRAFHDEGKKWHIKGSKRWVLAGNAADHFVVTARTAGDDGDMGGIGVFLLDADQVVRTAVKTMDGRRAAMLSIDVEVEPDRLLGPAEGDCGAIEHALDRGAAAACSEGYGVIKSSLAMTVEYLKTREQFGTKIGTFQALQHRAVDMFVESELAKSVAIMAALGVDDPSPDKRRRAVSAAKVQLALSGRFVTQQAIQLHGGIGVTDEHDIGLFFKRMHVLATLWGDEAHHLDRFAWRAGFVD
jgi:alkylation response protein AidB-like acyl-CoA dehydrogenase